MMENPVNIIVYLVAINCAACFMFYQDKKASRSNAWRVPEKTLLTLALFGGSAGAILAQQLLRHKTRKQPFKFFLYAIPVLQVTGLCVFAAIKSGMV